MVQSIDTEILRIVEETLIDLRLTDEEGHDISSGFIMSAILRQLFVENLSYKRLAAGAYVRLS